MSWAALFERATPYETSVDTVCETLRQHRESTDDD